MLPIGGQVGVYATGDADASVARVIAVLWLSLPLYLVGQALYGIWRRWRLIGDPVPVEARVSNAAPPGSRRGAARDDAKEGSDPKRPLLAGSYVRAEVESKSALRRLTRVAGIFTDNSAPNVMASTARA